VLEYANIPLSVVTCPIIPLIPRAKADFRKTSRILVPTLVSNTGALIQFSCVGTTKTKLGDISYNVYLSGVRRAKIRNQAPVIEGSEIRKDYIILRKPRCSLSSQKRRMHAGFPKFNLQVVSSLRIQLKSLDFTTRLLPHGYVQ